MTGVTVMVNSCGTLESTPPLAVPPLLVTRAVRVATPLASGAGVNLRMPPEVTDGAVANNPGLELESITKASVWPLSLLGPLERLAAQFLEYEKLSSSTVTLAAVKLGASSVCVTFTVTLLTAESSNRR